LIKQWRIEYNQQRPQSSLGYLTPQEFADRAAVFSNISGGIHFDLSTLEAAKIR
jgi:hypothetical protein